MTAARTPTPWKTSGSDIFGEGYCIASAHHPVTARSGNKEANAAFIVKACNAHDNLVSALDRILYIEDLDSVHAQADLVDARNILAKAKGE